MLAVSHRSFSALPSAHYGDMDESGTINPAALNAPGKHVFTGTRVRRAHAKERTIGVSCRRVCRSPMRLLTHGSPHSIADHRTEPTLAAEPARCKAKPFTGQLRRRTRSGDGSWYVFQQIRAYTHPVRGRDMNKGRRLMAVMLTRHRR